MQWSKGIKHRTADPEVAGSNSMMGEILSPSSHSPILNKYW